MFDSKSRLAVGRPSGVTLTSSTVLRKLVQRLTIREQGVEPLDDGTFDSLPGSTNSEKHENLCLNHCPKRRFFGYEYGLLTACGKDQKFND